MIGGLDLAIIFEHGIFGNDFCMKRLFLISCCCLCAMVISCVAVVRLVLVAKVFSGNGVVVRRVCVLNVSVSGRKEKCPGFVVERSMLPNRVSGSNGKSRTAMAVRINNDLGRVYWLDGDNVMLTRCNPLFDIWFPLDRWMLVSTTALHLTYDVKDDMKGLPGATVECSENDDMRVYSITHREHGIAKAILIEVNEKDLEFSQH